MENWEVSAYLQRIAELLAIKGENEYKIRSYQNASRIVSHLQERVEELVNRKELVNIKGIGAALSSKVEEMVYDGRSSLLEELQKEVPLELLSLFQVPGMGYKTVSRLVNHLQIENLDDLEAAAEEGLIRGVPGLGPSLEAKILKELQEKEISGSSFHQGIAFPMAQLFLERLREKGETGRLDIGGDLRRGADSVSEIVLIWETSCQTEEWMEEIKKIKEVDRLLSREENQASFLTILGIPVRIIAVSVNYPVQLLYSTGSLHHLQQLEKRAKENGFMLDRTGLYRGAEELTPGDETEIYSLLGLEYVPPELREGSGEIEAAAGIGLPVLVTREDVKGDLHLHTNWSDGNSTIEDMAIQARAKGYSYMAITDHSVSLKIAGGLSREKVLSQVEYIKGVRSCYPELHIFTGIEVDILTEGELDYPEEILSRLDVVIASIHSGFKQPPDRITERLASAVRHPAVNIIGHPTGRLIGKREPYGVDLEKIIDLAARYGKALEINSSPDRLDLSAYNACKAAKKGVPLVTGTDAHSSGGMDDIFYGIKTARRGWLRAEQLLNTWSPDEVRDFLGCRG